MFNLRVRDALKHGFHYLIQGSVIAYNTDDDALQMRREEEKKSLLREIKKNLLRRLT